MEDDRNPNVKARRQEESEGVGWQGERPENEAWGGIGRGLLVYI